MFNTSVLQAINIRHQLPLPAPLSPSPSKTKGNPIHPTPVLCPKTAESPINHLIITYK